MAALKDLRSKHDCGIGLANNLGHKETNSFLLKS